MPIQITQFSPGVLTAAQLNALVDAVVAKFNGQVTTGDILFPLTAGGNIDMSQFDLLHVYKFWQSRNLSERASSVTFQDVLDQVNTAGGGIVLLPANSTEIVGTTGVTVGTNTVIMGQGDTSIFNTSGTFTNHMFRNKANGNSGIMFVGCRIVGPTSGAFDAIAMTRTQNLKFVDCLLETYQKNAVSLRSDSAGSSCLDTHFERCRFQMATTASCVGLLAQDVQRLHVSNCKFDFQVSSSVGISLTALGATSNLEQVHIEHNDFIHTAGATQTDVLVAAGATNGIAAMSILDNDIKGASGTNTFGIDVDGGVYTVNASLRICDNDIRGQFDSAAVRIRNCAMFHVDRNDINISGTGIGILTGATARSGAVASCGLFSCKNNIVVAAATCYVFTVPASSTMRGTIANNTGSCSSGTVAEFEIWSTGANPTTATFDTIITGNMVDDASASVASWRCYTGIGATQGGRCGAANNSNLIFSANNAISTTFGGAGANDDFHNVSEGTTRMYQALGNIN